MWEKIIILLVLLCLSAFFSAAETAFMSLGKFKYKEYIRKKKKNYKLVLKLKENPHKLISTILIGNNLVNIAAASLATLFGTEFFIYLNYNLSQAAAAGIITGVMTLIILIFAEIMPKTYASMHYEEMVSMSAGIVFLLSILFTPIIFLLDFTTNIFVKKRDMKENVTEDEIKTIVNVGSDEGGIDQYEKHLIHKIFQFDDKIAKEIMTPKFKVYSINANSKIKDALKGIIDEGYSRVPIYEGNPDNIVGVFHIKDILNSLERRNLNSSIMSISSKPYFVPESKPTHKMFKEMQRRKKQMAIVVDEYGIISGVLTIEDLLEEIVGEIYDEGEVKTHVITKVSKREFLIKGEATLREVKEKTEVKIDGMESETIGSYILGRLERIPKKGTVVNLKKGRLIINKVTDKNIEIVKLKI